MTGDDMRQWWDENERVNANAVLALNLRVEDLWGNRGKIIEIEYPDGELTREDHGGIVVELESIQHGKEPHPDHPHEHYVIFSWQRHLRLI